MPDAASLRPDPHALAVVRELKERLRRRFGDRLVAVYLFGSRARGDYRPDSDADVAVVLKDGGRDPIDERYDVIEDTYDLLLEKGLYIQPWTLPESALAEPDRFVFGTLAKSVVQEGVRV